MYLLTMLLDIPYLCTLGVGVSLYIAVRLFRFAARIRRESRSSETFPFKKFGSWAVVTGATDGIGKGVAFELARCRMNIVLISRTKSKLEKVAAELEETCGIKTRIIAADFSSDDIYDAIEEGVKDLDIGVLVNNVGLAQVDPTAFLDVPDFEKFSSKVCQINLVSILEMSRIIVPDMVKRGGGIVVNVASIIGSKNSPYYAVYGSSKAAGITLTQALRDEYKNTGVIFQCISPGMTATPLTKVKANFMIPSAEDYAKYVVKAIGKSGYTNTSFFWHNFFQIVLHWMPDFLYAKALNSGAEKALLGREN